MTTEEKNLIRGSYRSLEPKARETAEVFFGRLFEVDPALRRLFGEDVNERSCNLTQVLSAIVRGLDRLDHITPVVEALGRRYAAWLASSDYSAIGATLLWTLRQELGESFTAEVGDAWNAVYTMLAETMQRGAGEGTSSGGLSRERLWMALST